MKNSNSSQIIADNLKALRKQNNMKQEFVAEQLQVTRQAVSKWETGATEPSTANLKALSELYGVSVSEILKQGECNNKTDPNKKKTGIVKIILPTIAVGLVILIIGVLYANHKYYSKIIFPTQEKISSISKSNENLSSVAHPSGQMLDNSDSFWKTSHILTFNLGYYYEENKTFEGVFQDKSGLRFRIIGLKFETSETAADIFSSSVDTHLPSIIKKPLFSSDSMYTEYAWGDFYVYEWFDGTDYAIALAETKNFGDEILSILKK